MIKKVLFFCISFLIIINIVSAYKCTSTFQFDDEVSYHAGTTYEVDTGVCEYYNDYPDEVTEDMVIMEEDSKCYVTMYYENYDNPLIYYNGRIADESGKCKNSGLSAGGFVPNSQNVVNGSGAAGGSDPNMDPIIFDFLSQDNLNIAKLVKEINKGSLAQKFKNEFNLTSIKAATISVGNGEMLVIQYIPKNSTMQTLKINYSRDNKNSILNSSIVVNDISTNLLGEFPFWILEAAPDYNQDKVSESSKEALLAAFKDITNYKYSKNGTVYSVSASIPDDINPRVLAVYSNFLSENPLTAFAEEQTAASTEGQSTDQKPQNKVKNTKTGAFMSVKVIIIGLIVACIAGCFVYRYSKMKKI